MLKFFALFFLINAPDAGSLPEDAENHVITDESKCNHPALQIKDFKLAGYANDYRTDSAVSKYWHELPNGKVQQITVTRSNCEAPWTFRKAEIIDPYGEKL